MLPGPWRIGNAWISSTRSSRRSKGLRGDEPQTPEMHSRGSSTNASIISRKDDWSLCILCFPCFRSCAFGPKELSVLSSGLSEFRVQRRRLYFQIRCNVRKRC